MEVNFSLHGFFIFCFLIRERHIYASLTVFYADLVSIFVCERAREGKLVLRERSVLSCAKARLCYARKSGFVITSKTAPIYAIMCIFQELCGKNDYSFVSIDFCCTIFSRSERAVNKEVFYDEL